MITDYTEYEKKLMKMISTKRFEHSRGVAETSRLLAQKYRIDSQKAYLAGLLHDCARGISNDDLILKARQYIIAVSKIEENNPILLHGPVGAYSLKENFGIDDEEISSAVYWHTTGKAKMNMMEKIIFLADYIEPMRNFSGIETLRKLAWDGDINEALIQAYDQSLKYIIEQKKPIHPATIEGRNYLLL